MSFLTRAWAPASILGIGIAVAASSSTALTVSTEAASVGCIITADCDDNTARLEIYTLSNGYEFVQVGDTPPPEFLNKFVDLKRGGASSFGTMGGALSFETPNISQAESGSSITGALGGVGVDSTDFSAVDDNIYTTTVAGQSSLAAASGQASVQFILGFVSARPASLLFACGLVGLVMLSRRRKQRLV